MGRTLFDPSPSFQPELDKLPQPPQILTQRTKGRIMFTTTKTRIRTGARCPRCLSTHTDDLSATDPDATNLSGCNRCGEVFQTIPTAVYELPEHLHAIRLG